MSKGKIKIMPAKPGYDLAADTYDCKEAYLNSFEQGKAMPLLGDIKAKKILEVGAGTGRLTLELMKRGAEVTALDVSKAMLDILKKKIQYKFPPGGNLMHAVKIIVADAEALPFPDESFDWVVAAFMIVHLKDPTRFFDEAYRVLRPGGCVLVTNINQKEPPAVRTKQGNVKIESYYHRPERIRDLLGDLAFSIEHEYFVHEGETWVNQILVAKK